MKRNSVKTTMLPEVPDLRKKMAALREEKIPEFTAFKYRVYVRWPHSTYENLRGWALIAEFCGTDSWFDARDYVDLKRKNRIGLDSQTAEFQVIAIYDAFGAPAGGWAINAETGAIPLWFEVVLQRHLDAKKKAGVKEFKSTERPARPGELCTCGRPAVTVFSTEQHGDVGYCGIPDGGAHGKMSRKEQVIEAMEGRR